MQQEIKTIFFYPGGVTSTLILHPLDLIKIRFAGEFCKQRSHVELLPKVRSLSNSRNKILIKFLRPSQLDSVLKLQIPSPRSCDRSRKNRLQDGGKRNLEDENSCATCFSRAGIFNVFLFPLCLCTNPQSSMSLAKHEPLSLDVRLMFVYIQIKPAQSLSLLSDRVFNDSQLAEQQRSWLVSISNFTRGSRCSESSSDFLSSLQNKNNKTQSSCDFPECEKHFFLSSRKVFLIHLWARHGSQMSMNSIFKPF